jgi:hypothetical protein
MRIGDYEIEPGANLEGADERRGSTNRSTTRRVKTQTNQNRTTVRFKRQNSGRDGTRTRDPYHVEVVL